MSITDIITDSKRSSMLAIVTTGLGLAASACALLLQEPYLLNFVYLSTTVGVAALLYISDLKLYFGFVWVLWFISPFVRRVIDFTVGEFNYAPFPLLAPSLATCLSLLSLLQFTNRLTKPPYSGLALLFIGSSVGLFSGLLSGTGVVAVINGYLEYIAPICLCFHLIAFWRIYPSHRDMALRIFVLGTIVMGAYGIYQYFVLPGWDRMWMIGSEMLSIGHPNPRQLRVFGTLNSPGPYSMVLAGTLIYAFLERSIVIRILTSLSYIAWLLTFVRASWIGWVVGIGFCIFNTRGPERSRLVYVLAITIVIALPIVMTTDAIESRVTARAGTLSNVEEDGSFQGRMGIYRQSLDNVLSNPLGRGVGAKATDSGFISIFLHLGLVGGALYYIGFAIVLRHAWQARSRNADSFSRYALSVSLMFCFVMLAGDQHVSVNGCLLWGSLGLAVSGNMYCSSSNSNSCR